MRRSANIYAALLASCALLLGWVVDASAAQAPTNPLTADAGIYKLGVGPGTGSTGIPYALTDGTTGTLTARHAVGDPSATHWAITDAAGAGGFGVDRAASTAVDTAFLQGSAQWTKAPNVKLSSDYSARFAAVATSRADVVAGDRICRTGWSPLDGTGSPAAGTPNVNAPPDIAPSAGASVICGRIASVQGSTFWIGSSDRPDGAIVAPGDSGGIVWKVTDDGAFMFLGLITGAAVQTPTTVDGLATYSYGEVQAAWAIDADKSLNVHPLLTPNTTPFFVISTSTYHPARGARATLQGSLRDRDGNPIRSATVQVLSGTTVVGTAVTDKNGNLAYRSPVVIGTTHFAFRFNGDSTHPAKASRIITLSPTGATINASVATQPKGSRLHVTAHVSDSSGAAVIGRTVALRIYPGATASFSVVATGTTDTHGNVTLSGPAVMSKLRYSVRLSADPNTNGDPYGAATSSVHAVAPR